MSRIITADSSGKQRLQLMKAITLALRELSRQPSAGDEARDLAAFIAMALQVIEAGIDSTVAPWEKRGYWVKADKFRMEWAWTGQISSRLKTAVRTGDWDAVTALSMHIAGKFSKVKVSDHHKLGKPWLGAFGRLSVD